MERLPAEVFNEVLDHLEPRGRESPAEASRRNPWAQPQPHKPDHIDSRQHYSRLRLVCKRFDELATPYLFRSIGLRFNLKSFGRLEKLAARPGLSRHVRKFVYLMPYLYEEGIIWEFPCEKEFALRGLTEVVVVRNPELRSLPKRPDAGSFQQDPPDHV
jgi:hypothetical protein